MTKHLVRLESLRHNRKVRHNLEPSFVEPTASLDSASILAFQSETANLLIEHSIIDVLIDELSLARSRVATEIWESEKVYVKRLEALIKLYKKPLLRCLEDKHPLLPAEAIDGIFSNVDGTGKNKKTFCAVSLLFSPFVLFP